MAAYRGTIAAAVEAEVKTDPGSVVFFDAATGSFLSQVTVLVANEGEPNDDYTIDPEGSVSLIDLKNGVPNLTQGDVFASNQRRAAETASTSD